MRNSLASSIHTTIARRGLPAVTLLSHCLEQQTSEAELILSTGIKVTILEARTDDQTARVGEAIGKAARHGMRDVVTNMAIEQQTDFPLPADLPEPVNDGAADHLVGTAVPRVSLFSTAGRMIDLTSLSATRTVLYCYPMTGVPGKPLPEGWDIIPGARGCTPQACSFRDHYREISALQAEVFGLSTQPTGYQREMAERLHLPFEILSDAEFTLCDALRLPTFEVGGMRLLKRLTLIIRSGRIEHVFYPVFPPNESADQVVHWLTANPPT